VWYSPAFFGKAWTKLMGFDVDTVEGKTAWEKREKETQKTWVLTVLGALILSYALAYFVSMFSAVTVADALQIGFVAWFAFIATTSFISTLFAKKSKMLWAIDNCYPLISMLLMSILFVLWR
jgi:predicted transporter